MGQKVHPFGFRLGIFEDWHAHWFAKKNYGKELQEDLAIRDYLSKNLSNSEISKLIIDKAGDSIRIVIFSGRPGIVIGKKGVGIDSLREKLFKRFGKNIEVSVQEERSPGINSQLVASNIAEQLERRAHFKRVMKKIGFSVLKCGAKGIKIQMAGRLGGAEMARREKQISGSIPLSTLRAKIDYGFVEAKTAQGHIGVQVWINQGMFEDETDGADAQEGQAQKKPARSYKR